MEIITVNKGVGKGIGLKKMSGTGPREILVGFQQINISLTTCAELTV